MALNYPQDLLGELGSREVRVPIFMAGKLNQNIDGDLPKDVTEDFRKLDIIAGNNVFGMIGALRGDQAMREKTVKMGSCFSLG